MFFILNPYHFIQDMNRSIIETAFVPVYLKDLEMTIDPIQGFLQEHPGTVALGALELLFLFKIILTIRTSWTHLSTIPGPRWASYTRLWLCKTIASGDSAQVFVNVNKKQGLCAPFFLEK